MIRVLKLVERERELAAVEALLEGRGALLLVEGGAGIGKTSLIEVGCRRAEELGYEILRSRGSELEGDFAFGVVRQLFERRLAAAGLTSAKRCWQDRLLQYGLCCSATSLKPGPKTGRFLFCTDCTGWL
jgi:predicted ATPase